MKGGNRKGAGRPKGSTTRPQIRSYFTKEEIELFVEDLKETAKTDPGIKKFLAEQIFGKAVQPIGNDEGQPLIVQFDSTFLNAITPETETDSVE